MLRFLQAHATHPVPELALEMVWAQLASQMATPSGTAGAWLPAGEPSRDAPTLGWCYISDGLAHGAQAVLDGLRQRMPQVAWVGAVGAGVLATHVEYMDEPALSVMLCNLPREDFRIFHGRQPLPALPRGRRHPADASLTGQPGWRAHTALVHADARTPDLPELIAELASRTDTGYLFGGLSASQRHPLHLALAPEDATSPPNDAPAAPQPAAGVWHGGLSGVAFGEGVRLVEDVNNPGVKLHLDVKAMTSEGRPVAETLRLEGGRHLWHFHANDPNLRGPGMGELAFEPIMQALQDVKYDRWVSVEVFDFTPGPEATAELSLKTLKRALAG